jgi:hypothetical protein
MKEEYSALIHNKTWHLVPPSRNNNIIDCNGYIVLRKEQMVLLTDTMPDWLQKGSSKGMALIMRILLVH